jgi:hypothetical protein
MEGLPMTRTRHAVPRWKLLAVLFSAGIAVPVLLAGCGEDKGTAASGSGDSRASGTATANDASTGPDGLTDRQKTSLEMRRKEEDMIAACMRRSGFTYKPYIPQQILHPFPDEPTDYEGLKAHRNKYGFGFFSSHVYKGDPHVTVPEDNNPNDAVVAALDPDQQKAYRLALSGRPPAPRTKDYLKPSEGCIGEAVKAVDPQARKQREELAKSVSSGQEPPGGAARRAARAQLAPLEPEYASCLHTKGIPTSPGNGPADLGVSDFASKLVQQRYDQLAFRSGSDGPHLDPDVARKELKREIKIALDDLECGKQYLPMQSKLRKQLDDAEPPTGGLY